MRANTFDVENIVSDGKDIRRLPPNLPKQSILSTLGVSLY